MEHTKSYANFGFSRSWQQLTYAMHDRQRAEKNMLILFDLLQIHEKRMENKMGRPLKNMRFLEIGPGQGMERARYFGIHNEVVAIDLDIIPQGFQPGNYWQMLRSNGFGRFFKTIGRKLILGQANNHAWEKVVGNRNMPMPQFIHGDICQPLEEIGTFDVIMSWSVFEHLPEPQQALENIINLLQPGGIFYISLHLFTSHNGHHDIRAFTGRESQLPLWGHLREGKQHLFEPSSYLNKWRLADWRALFNELTPDADEYLESYGVMESLGSQLDPKMRKELADFSDEELFTVDLIYVWQKPFD